MMVILLLWLGCMSFRPLSWGLSFNELKPTIITTNLVFVPFLGDFLSIGECDVLRETFEKFSSPFLGTFFQSFAVAYEPETRVVEVFVPFLGDFLSI